MPRTPLGRKRVRAISGEASARTARGTGRAHPGLCGACQGRSAAVTRGAAHSRQDASKWTRWPGPRALAVIVVVVSKVAPRRRAVQTKCQHRGCSRTRRPHPGLASASAFKAGLHPREDGTAHLHLLVLVRGPQPFKLSYFSFFFYLFVYFVGAGLATVQL